VSLHRRFGSAAGPDLGDLVLITPDDAGWEWSGLRVVRLEPGVPRLIRTGPSEVFVLPLAGGLQVSIGPEGDGRVEARYDLAGRTSVFTHVSDFAYAGRDSELVLASAGGAEVALPAARCTTRLAPAYGAAEDVPVELRGAGQASRQVNNFGVPGVWDHAEKLIGVEVLTPPGNWSSYPAHKHDASEPCPLAIEEVYLYRIAGADQVTPARSGFGYHRTYTGPEHDRAGLAPIDLFAEVRDLDVVLVPHGYHGPCVAAPGYPLYYLNVMAGPAPERAWAFCDDPAHAWIRATWAEQDVDPRLPATSAAASSTSSRSQR
jgi:5-deoxy-glucuronate isomerase